jgi:hypothetical protein
MGFDSTELALGWGFLHAHEGRTAEAAPWFERALALAARDQDHWREWAALARMTAMALEDGDPALALRHCEFEATDAEQIRDSARSAGIPFDRCWSADVYLRDNPTASY